MDNKDIRRNNTSGGQLKIAIELLRQVDYRDNLRLNNYLKSAIKQFLESLPQPKEDEANP